MEQRHFYGALVIVGAALVFVGIGFLITPLKRPPQTIEVKSPATLYLSSELRVAEIRGEWPKAEDSRINRWLDSANVYVVDVEFERSSCYITYVKPKEDQ